MSRLPFDSEKIRGSITSLKELYSGVLALALYEAIRGVAETPHVLLSIQFQFFILAFCTTLVPFYHGTIRYFDDSYLPPTLEPNPASFMVDYLFFCTQGGLLVWMGAIFGTAFSEDYFIKVYAGLLAVDFVWGFMTHFLTGGFSKVKAWVWLDFAVLLALALLRARFRRFEGYHFTTFLIIALARSILDYALNWDMYFPRVHVDREILKPIVQDKLKVGV